MKPYRINVNWEWTSKCNARCAMCPRSMIGKPQLSTRDTFEATLARLDPRDVFRTIIAGYGEPTTHPRFDAFVDALRGHPVPFDLATNGSRLDETRLRGLDGVLDRLMVSFSSIDPDVYRSVHSNLDQRAVMDGIVAATRLLKKTRLVINLSPTRECLDTIEQTIGWFHAHGVTDLHMSPTYYDRAGAISTADAPAHTRLRETIARHRLRSQEQAFISGAGDFVRQWYRNRFRCMPRNISLLISADGHYNYCFNDIRQSHHIGHVSAMSVREALEIRERSEPDAAICDQCNLRHRYGPRELARVAVGYVKSAVAA